MSRVSLGLFKKHVRADDFTCDDEYLLHVLEAAEDYVVGMTGYTKDELSVIPDEEFPMPLKHAIMMRGASMYAYREDVDSSNLAPLPNSLSALVKPYCKMHGGGLMEDLVNKYKGQ